MAFVVKITRDDNGESIENAKWCWIDATNAQGAAAFCSAQFFGPGESRCEYKVKEGKITCPECIKKIKTIKEIKL